MTHLEYDRLQKMIAAKDARLSEDGAIRNALATPGLTDIMLTFDHPEFGIECTAVIGERDATVTNQPDAISAIINAISVANALPLGVGE